MAAPECEREVRKRRERRDSGCAHERKERRPHSEERIPTPSTPPLHDYNRLESERRAERLSRARRPQHGGKRRRQPARAHRPPKENERNGDHTYSPTLDFTDTNSHSTAVCEEPETLDAGALSLAADAVAGRWEADAAQAERTRRDERSVSTRDTRRDSPGPATTLDKIIKKINVLKKSIARHESEYEAQNGHPITPSDRITDVQLTRMYDNLRRLQAEKRCIKADPVEYAMKVQAAKLQKERDDNLDLALNSDKPMTDVVKDIEEWLEGCRELGGRASQPESSWSPSQLAAEKACVQRVLLRLEAARGRPPAHSAERGAARHLYERYRAVKRALAASRSDTTLGTAGELATILEHETMLFNSSVDSSSESQDKPSDCSQETSETPLQSPPHKEGSNTGGIAEEMPSSASSAPSGTTSEERTPSNEGLHCLALEDLIRAMAEAKLHKIVLRRSIKEYEQIFELQNSRKVQRDDKKIHEDEYMRYKAIKARIKLLNALINKQKTVM